MIASCSPSVEQIQDEFVEFLPSLTGRLSRRFWRWDPQSRADAIAEAVGLAWTTYLSARLRNKQVTVGNLAHYSSKAVAAGRKVAGTTSLDAMSDTATSRTRLSPTVSLDTPGLSHKCFIETFGDKRWRWPVLAYVAPIMDFKEFEAACRPRDRQIMALKLEGTSQVDIARAVGISPPAVNQRLRELRRRWDAMTPT